MERIVEEHGLCKKLCDLYKTTTACFQYTIKDCKGACVQEESSEEYNKRCEKLISLLNLNGESFYVIDKGRTRGEKSLILIENGLLKGIGYAPYHMNRIPISKWEKFIDITTEDRDARTILKLFLRKDTSHEIVRID